MLLCVAPLRAKATLQRNQRSLACMLLLPLHSQCVQKWCLLVLSQLLSGDATHRDQALPWQEPLRPLLPGHDEWMEVLSAVAALAVAGMHRWVGWERAEDVAHTSTCKRRGGRQMLQCLNQ